MDPNATAIGPPNATRALTGTGRARRAERGASLVEYALMISLIAVACIVALSAFGVTNGGSINNSANEIVTAGGG